MRFSKKNFNNAQDVLSGPTRQPTHRAYAAPPNDQLEQSEHPLKISHFLLMSPYHVSITYSVLSAVIGEMEAARLAGIIAATNAATASALAATIRANGSQLETP